MMLGFDGALDATTSARFGQGSWDILLNRVGCDGTEKNLADCAHLGIGVNYCRHGEDAGAICFSGGRCLPCPKIGMHTLLYSQAQEWTLNIFG